MEKKIINDITAFCKASSWKRVKEEKNKRQKIFLAVYDLEKYPPYTADGPIEMGGDVVVIAHHKYDFLIKAVKTLLELTPDEEALLKEAKREGKELKKSLKGD